jgi:predicted Ser/Thr protein kinase
MDALVDNLMNSLVSGCKERFEAQRNILSFDDYLKEVAKNPKWHLRGAAAYFSDMFDYFGSAAIRSPAGEYQRSNLFDAPFDQGFGRVMGHERVQERLRQLVQNFVRAGKVDRLILMHGPNGSAKTSIAHALARAGEVYSQSMEGALYRLVWVFPAKHSMHGNLGFSGALKENGASYAYLDHEELQARLPCEQKDHPLLLLEREARLGFIGQLKESGHLNADFLTPEFLHKGELSHKNHKIFQALLAAYHGNLAEVLRHVQVERFYLSKRYRRGLATVEPQMGVDAYVRQVTQDQSVANLPAALHHVTLHEVVGPLADANRGMLEYSDLLKRPIESWKYLLVATEQTQASLDAITVFFDMLMLASSNELHLASFKEYPDWPSFKGRFELVRVPYLTRFSDELAIYRHQIPMALSSIHIAPHALEVAARWAVLTRLEPPRPERYKDSIKELVRSLTPFDKLELYDNADTPERFTQMEAREFQRIIPFMMREYDGDIDYEGRNGASPREIRTVLLNAAHLSKYGHLSPFGVLEELRELCRNRSSYEFLRREAIRGFRDPVAFLEVVERQLRKTLELEVRSAMGLLSQGSQQELFERYVRHVSAWTKKEKVPDAITQRAKDPDADLMGQVERVLLAKAETPEDFRRALISRIGAFRLENPEQPVDYSALFGTYLKRLCEAYYEGQQKTVERIMSCFLKELDGDVEGLDAKERELTHTLRSNLHTQGYSDESAKQTVVYLLKNLAT